jgi:hypothetical protein
LIKARGGGALVGTVASRRFETLSRTVVTHGRVRAGSPTGRTGIAGLGILGEPARDPQNGKSIRTPKDA